MKRKSGNNKFKYLLVLLLLVTVGYAAIATTLKINGSSNIKNARWNVYWDNESIQVTEGSVSTTQGNEARVVDSASTIVEYSVELNQPGDFYEFIVDAVNDGSLNAEIAPNGVRNNVYESDGTTLKELPDYIGYSVKYADDDSDVTAGDILEAKKGNTPTRRTYKVKVWYRTDIDPSILNESTNETMKLAFEVDYVQASKNNQQQNNQESSESDSAIKILSGTKGNLQPGDKVRIGETEDFYVLSSDNSENGKTKLLAKYNLLVGGIIENGELVDQIPIVQNIEEHGYGLQSSEATAYDGDGSYIGATHFAGEVYFNGKTGPGKKYGGNDSGNPYPYVYDTESFVCVYIEGSYGYLKKLKDMGAPSTITGRLLSYEEADEARAVKDNGTSIIFDGHQSYWLGSSTSFLTLWSVRIDETEFDDLISYATNRAYGVRPVIEIYTSDI